ncbi:MAG: sugar phosphorylase [Planctomycetota bacterium]
MAESFDTVAAELLQSIYGHVPDVLARGIEAMIGDNPSGSDATGQPSLWDHRDVVLITYADQIRQQGHHPLAALRSFLVDHKLPSLIDCVHLLPFNPYTSDDGFSVVDYLAVDPDSGTWEDIEDLGLATDLMFDLVLNHCSQKHEYFQKYLAGDPAYADFFIDQDPAADLSAVIRPRSLPLLSPYQAGDGTTRHIWTTFSADQVDLNYENPNVMLAMLQTLVEYARRGARIIRLDAIAFLWKELGTTCLHLPQTHAAVKLMRRVLDLAVPGTLVLTETNVPHKENISYFGDGTDEAHMVYQFSLPPLMLDAIHSGQTDTLRDWMASLQPPSDQTTFFNFTASHDGVGVRPLEGLVSDDRIDRLVDVVRRHQGRVNMRAMSDGTERPYEMNITYVDAVADRSVVPPSEHSRRFLATQAVMLAMQGMPAIYFHSLVGSPNDIEGMERSGQNRRINRHKYERSVLETRLDEPDGLQRRIFGGFQQLLRLRRQQPAFHPSAPQSVLDLPTDGTLGFVRTSADGQPLVSLCNLSDQVRRVDSKAITQALGGEDGFDLVADQAIDATSAIDLRPYQVRWLVPK